MKIHPLAGKLVSEEQLVDVPKLVAAYYTEIPDPSISDQSVSFGTSGHRGSSFEKSFNEPHILAITQAICLYRDKKGINGPLFLGMDTHALSEPAFRSTLEVLAANGVTVLLSANEPYTPTPVISHAILTYNKGKTSRLADGIVLTPSHNPPSEGGIKYNPPNGGPADQEITNWVQAKANEFMKKGLKGVKRVSFEKALKARSTQLVDFMSHYINDLKNVVNMSLIKASKITMGVDPLGGAGVHFWGRIAEKYRLDLTVVNTSVDPTFRFMTLDWDGKVRMDPSSPYAMQSLIKLKNKFDISFACDTDHDRHGIVTRSSGLLPPNHYLSSAIYYLIQHRPKWSKKSAIGKTVVSSLMIDKVAEMLHRKVYEVPVGFKWFVDGLLDSSLSFVGEESAGGSFERMDGSVWTTDKDGIILCLLAAEITAKLKKDPGEVYKQLAKQFGSPLFERIDAPATPAQKEILKKLSPDQVKFTKLAGEEIEAILTKAPGNHEPIGGLKVVAKSGWFAARPSGTENIYKIYAESFKGKEHLRKIQKEAQSMIDATFKKMR